MRPVAGRFERSCAASSVAAMRTIPVRGRNNVGKDGNACNIAATTRRPPSVSQPPLTRQPKNFFDQPGRCRCAEREVVIRIRDDAVEQWIATGDNAKLQYSRNSRGQGQLLTCRWLLSQAKKIRSAIMASVTVETAE
jgi:hypothetical protein